MKIHELVKDAHDLNEVIYLSMTYGGLDVILGNAQTNARNFLSQKFQAAIMKAETPEVEQLLFELWTEITGEAKRNFDE